MSNREHCRGTGCNTGTSVTETNIQAEQHGLHQTWRSHHRIQQGLQIVHYNETEKSALFA